MYIHVIMSHAHNSTTHYGIHLQLIFIMIPINMISMTTSVPLLKGAITIKQAKKHVKQPKKNVILLQIFMWCHFNVMLIMGSYVK